MLTLPGLIDPHVHFRTPGQSHKEDFTTGTQAAIAGGFTTVIDMPNNANPVTSLSVLNEKRKIAEKQRGNVPFGVPGLETTLPLFLTAVHEGKLTIHDLKRLCHDNSVKFLELSRIKIRILKSMKTKNGQLKMRIFIQNASGPRFMAGTLKEN